MDDVLHERWFARGLRGWWCLEPCGRDLRIRFVEVLRSERIASFVGVVPRVVERERFRVPVAEMYGHLHDDRRAAVGSVHDVRRSGREVDLAARLDACSSTTTACTRAASGAARTGTSRIRVTSDARARGTPRLQRHRGRPRVNPRNAWTRCARVMNRFDGCRRTAVRRNRTRMDDR